MMSVRPSFRQSSFFAYGLVSIEEPMLPILFKTIVNELLRAQVFDLYNFYPTNNVPANASTYENGGNCYICLSDYSNQKKRKQCEHVIVKNA